MRTSVLEPKELRRPDVLWATGLGVGFAKPAPGTWGSVAALAVWWLWLHDLPPPVQLAIATTYFLVGWWCSSSVCRRYQVKDAPQIVADEVAGMWFALAFAPYNVWAAVAAFGLFRLLDITKPGPVGWLDREVGGGLGVMLDDVVAGLCAGGVLWLAVSVIG